MFVLAWSGRVDIGDFIAYIQIMLEDDYVGNTEPRSCRLLQTAARYLGDTVAGRFTNFRPACSNSSRFPLLVQCLFACRGTSKSKMIAIFAS